MDMIQAVRLACHVFGQQGRRGEKRFLIRPVSYRDKPYLTNTWYIVDGTDSTTFLVEAFLHPDGYVLTAPASMLPGCNGILEQWEVLKCPVMWGPGKFVAVTEDDMKPLREALAKGLPLPSGLGEVEEEEPALASA